ncbi:hypothetical protein Q9233_016883 [Columba guinea]|nr:hypothetical protein Q9233_016883 [Columba guinea]
MVWIPSQPGSPHGSDLLTAWISSQPGSPHSLDPLTDWTSSQPGSPHGLDPLMDWISSQPGSPHGLDLLTACAAQESSTAEREEVWSILRESLCPPNQAVSSLEQDLSFVLRYMYLDASYGIYAEIYLADGLQNETLSAKAREQRDAILFGFQQVRARYHLECVSRGEYQHDAGVGQDSSDENQSWSVAPSVASEASLPSDFQDDARYSIVKGLEVWGLLSKLEYSSCTLEYTPAHCSQRVLGKPSKTGYSEAIE